MLRLAQMKWNGTVSHLGQASIAAMFARQNPPHASSTFLCRNAVATVANGLDRSVGTELAAQAPHTDVDDVGTGVAGSAPHIGHDARPRHDLAGVPHQVVQHAELALGKFDHARADARL